MKKGNKTFGRFKKALALMLAMAMVFTVVNPLTVSAKRKITLKSSDGVDISVSAVDPIATPIKTGSYTVFLEGDAYSLEGYAKFVAPKTKTYNITLKKASSMGYVSALMPTTTPDVLRFTDMKTKGPKKDELDFNKKTYENYLKKRTGKIRLHKGDEVYFLFSVSSAKKGKTKVDFTIK